MSENVIHISGGEIASERKARFLDSVALSFDNYVDEHGFEPEAVVYVLCGVTQPSRIAWDITADSVGGPISCIALAAVHMMAEAHSCYESKEG